MKVKRETESPQGPSGLPGGLYLEYCSKHFRSASWRTSNRLWLNIKCVQWYERPISAASVLLMETSITCPLIFHSHLGAVNPRRNRYTDTQASCVITRGTMSAQLPVLLHSSGFQLTWADPHANHTRLLSTSRMKRIMLLGWCSSQQEGRTPPESLLTGTSVAVIYHVPSGQRGAKRVLRGSRQPPLFRSDLNNCD